MAEYIERSSIKYEQWAVGPLNEPLMVVRKKTIDSIPAADVAPVVRCKDCKWGKTWKNRNGIEGFKCDLMCVDLSPEAFCSYGERKDGEG